ncbi:TPA: hypothetical protein ACH3X1_003691 [Trebouxia sp. C0004]
MSMIPVATALAAAAVVMSASVRALVDCLDVQLDRRQLVADTLQELGYLLDEPAGEALGALTEAQLPNFRVKAAGLNVREINALLVRFKPQGSSANDDVRSDIQEIRKMLKSRSEATRQASIISDDDLEAVLVSLKCTVVSVEHEDVGVTEDVEYTWAENKYEPQQQEEYLQALKNEVHLPNHFSWVQTAKDNPSLLKTTMSSGGAELPFPIGCKKDECIVIRRSATIPETSITCTIEVKRHVVKQSLRQALTQFVCASLKSNLPVISTLTDMTKVGIAYYTTGEKTPDGWTIITQRYSATAKGVMQFLAAAMSSIPPDFLRTDTWGNFNLRSVLLEPTRRRLPTPSLSQTTTLQRMNWLQQIIDGKADVADLSDLE